MVRRTGEARVVALLVVALVAAMTALVVAATWTALADRPETALDLALAGTAVGALALLVAQMGRPPRIELRADGGDLVVRFHGWDALWTLRREVRVPLAQITEVGVRHVDTVAGGWSRRRGTAVPGVIQAGSFVRHGVRELWDVRAGADAVDIELTTEAPLHRLVLQLPDPTDAAARLRRATRHGA